MNLSPFKFTVFFFIFVMVTCYANPSPANDTVSGVKNQAPAFSSVEERRIFYKMLESQKKANNQKKDLAQREKELKTLNEMADKKLEEINKKLQELQSLQDNLKSLLAQKSAKEKKKVKELSLIYEKMTPDKAALALANMDAKLATEILGNMRARSAAKILDALSRKKASELSTRFSTVKSP